MITDERINELINKHVEGLCIHENATMIGLYGVRQRYCKDCDEYNLGLVIRDYLNDAEYVLGKIKEQIGILSYIPGGTWVARHKNGTEKHDTVMAKDVNRAVLLAVLKKEGVKIDE